jgi:hypothetical protein
VPQGKPASVVKNVNSGEETVSLGVLRLCLDDVQELIRMLKKNKRRVDLYAGSGFAPRGVRDLDDAQPEELANLQIKVERPQLTVRLGEYGASVTSQKGNPHAKRLQAEVVVFAENFRTWLPPFAYYTPAFFWLALWGGANALAPNMGFIDHISHPWAALFITAEILALMVSTVMLVRSYMEATRLLKRAGHAKLVSQRRARKFIGHERLTRLTATGAFPLAILLTLEAIVFYFAH